jgi:hypothetical protein
MAYRSLQPFSKQIARAIGNRRGEYLSNHIRTCKLNENINSQLIWMNPV